MKKKILSMILCGLLCLCVTTGLIVFAVGNQADITVQFHYDPSLTTADAKDLPKNLEINLSENQDAFSADFVLQNIVGYEPSVVRTTQATAGGELNKDTHTNVTIETSGTSKVLKFDDLDVSSGNPLTFHVYYTAVDVSYRVKYFFQNPNNDNYTEIAALAKAGVAKTGTQYSDVQLKNMINGDPNLPADYETGYKLLHSIPDSVAADGSTVFQVYFDRKYYSIDFDLGGGFGVEPVYTRYGANVSVGTPVRPGYNFTGWTITVGDAALYSNIPSTMPATNLKYVANWESNGEVKYTVAYWATDGDGKTYLLGSKVEMSHPGITVSGRDDITDDYVCGLDATSHTHNEDCIAPDHVCTKECGSPSGLDKGDIGTDDFNAIKNIPSGYAPGYIYIIRTSETDSYWLKYYDGSSWYHSGGLSKSQAQNYVDLDAVLDSGSAAGSYNRTFYAKKYKAKGLNCPPSCGIESHTHSNAECKLGDGHLEFLRADQNVEVKGDGTTVINVYYTHRNYTLRFYYARSSGTGSNIKYEVVGGSTYYFGSKSNGQHTTIQAALQGVPDSEWGEVSQPTIINAYLGKSGVRTGQTTFTGNNYTYYYFEFTAAYGSDISQLWPVDMFESVTIQERHTADGHSVTNAQFANGQLCALGNKAYFSAWNGEYRVKYTQDNGNPTVKGKYTILDENLIFDPAYDDQQVPYTGSDGEESYLVNYLCFWENGADIHWSKPKKFIYKFEFRTDDQYVLDESRTFVVYDDSNYASQTAMTIKGFRYVDRSETSGGTQDGLVTTIVTFKYDIIKDQTIKFKNEGVVVKEVTGEPYGKKLVDCLDGFDYNNPPYPSTLEANAYIFKGWCTYYPCSEDTLLTKAELEAYTIPESDAVLYAYWVKKEYTVTFQDNFGGNTLYTFGPITHGNSLEDKTITDPTKDGDIFAGWFYMDGAQRKKFDPEITPVKDNLTVFAMWEGTTPQQYTVKFVYKLNDGTEVEIADPITGYARQNSTKTFQAKGGAELYATYQTNYYPLNQSHSIVMGASGNEYTFEYFHVDEQLTYTVRYVDSATGLDLPINDNEKGIVNGVRTVTTNASYVTERYYSYNDGANYYTPDTFSKSLVLSVKRDEKGNYVNDAEKNVIIFYYTKQDNPTGYYRVNFYLEKLGNGNATLTTSNCDLRTYVEGSVELVLNSAGKEITLALPSYTGFTAVGNKNTITFTVTPDGTEINVFYNRESYEYSVVLVGSSQVTLPGTRTGEYGATVTYELSASDKKYFEGYKPIDTSNSVVINENAAQNIIYFYYEPIQYVVRYETVTFIKGEKQSVGTLGGKLTYTSEVVTGGITAKGSTASANEYYDFAGWYKEPSCVTKVSENPTFTPAVAQLNEDEATTFYAKFVRKAANLTIIRENAADENQVFVYKITEAGSTEAIYVTIRGNGSVTIHNMLQGEYTIVQQNDWSWRYDDALVNDVITIKGDTTVTFSKNAVNNQWLSSNNVDNTGTHGS